MPEGAHLRSLFLSDGAAPAIAIFLTENRKKKFQKKEISKKEKNKYKENIINNTHIMIVVIAIILAFFILSPQISIHI